jgi:DNA-binding NtrC family response regulator
LVMGDDSVEFTEFASKPETKGDSVSWPNSVSESNPDNRNGEPQDPGSLKILVRNLKGEAERNAIASTLEKTHWNRKAAARELGISYRGLLYKIQDYQLAPPMGYLPAFPTNAAVRRKGQEE